MTRLAILAGIVLVVVALSRRRVVEPFDEPGGGFGL